MHLKRIALKHANEPMDAWDPETESWVPDAFRARIDLTDRFLSNFNKPTRRRMMFADNTVKLPESLTCRHPGTLDVYVLGTTRQDAREGRAYLGMTICQLATDVPGGNAGLGTYTRKVPVGPPDDPGWLVDTVVGKAFTDLEFRTSSNEPDTHDMKIENFLLYTALNISLEAWDYLHLKGKDYRLIDAFVDSGFTSARVDEEVDTRMDFILVTSEGKVYNKETERFEGGVRKYKVTGVPLRNEDFALWTDESENYVDVYFEKNHIGVEPKAGMSLIYKNKVRIVRHVGTQDGERQWLLRCN